MQFGWLRARWLSIPMVVAISVGGLPVVSMSASAVAPASSAGPAGGAGGAAVDKASLLMRSASSGMASAQGALTVGAPTCNDAFGLLSTVNNGIDGSQLNSVAALSSTDAWAVGNSFSAANIRQPLAEHFDGTEWTIAAQPAAATSAGDNVLTSVSAVASNDVWAVGFWRPDNTAPHNQLTLIEHYAGWPTPSWSIVYSPSALTAGGMLFGVKALSASDVWAVGQSTIAGTTSPLIEHWNGLAWTIETGASTSSPAGLAGVLPLSATDVWAAGSAGGHAYAEHWDGTTWTAAALPVASATGVQFLSGIGGAVLPNGKDDLWAVGGASSSPATDTSLALHFDGTSWSAAPTPSPDLSANLIGVRYTAANDVWAVGASAYANPSLSSELDRSLIEHWDGSRWASIWSPAPSASTDVFDAAFAAPNAILTVGLAQDQAGGAPLPMAAQLCEPVPTVSEVSPETGNGGGGTTVSITGAGLSFPHRVMFGSTPALSYRVDSDSRIKAVAPPQALGTTVNVLVTTMGGTSAATAGDRYTYIFCAGEWEDDGGVLAESPVAVAAGSGHLDAFVRGTDHQVWHFNAVTPAWEAVPGLLVSSDVSAAKTGTGSFIIFARGQSDEALYYDVFNGTGWGGWIRLGGRLLGTPAAVSTAPGTVDVFVEGTDKRLWHLVLDTMTGKQSWSDLGGVLKTPPTAVSVTANVADALMQGTDDRPWHWRTGSTSGGDWSNLGGRLADQPALNLNADGVLDAFVEGTDDQLWHWSNAGGTASWELLGGKLGSAPSATSPAPGRLDVAVRGTDGALWHAWNTGSGWNWEGLGGVIVGPPAAVSWGPNRMDVFARGTDNALWHLVFD